MLEVIFFFYIRGYLVQFLWYSLLSNLQKLDKNDEKINHNNRYMKLDKFMNPESC